MKYGTISTAGAILLGLCTILATNSAHAENVTIPDPALEAIVRNAIEEPTGPLDTADLAALEKITVYESEVRDLTGLEHCVNLTDLNAQSNQIENISALAKMPQLERLFLNNNAIADISPLSGLTALTYVSIPGNPIESIAPLAGLRALKRLNLGGLKISDVDVLARLTSIEELYVHEMDLSNLDFVTGMTGLSQLTASRNQIQSLEPLRNLKNLVALELDSNQISDLSPLSESTHVRRLDLGYNQIRHLDALPLLTPDAVVVLFHNQITDLQPLERACGYASGINIEVGQNPLTATAFCQTIPALAVRGNRVLYRYSGSKEKIQSFPNVDTLCATPDVAGVDLVLAALNSGATEQELQERFGIGGDSATKMANANTDLPQAVSPVETPTEPQPQPADGTSAALAVTLADTQFNVSLESTGFDLQSLLGGIVLLGVGVMLVIAWRMPRPQ